MSPTPSPPPEVDPVDARLLDLLQRDGKQSFAKLAEHVRLCAAAVHERVRKLETAGVIVGYRAIVDPAAVGLGVTGFVGVTVEGADELTAFVAAMSASGHVQEMHHVTGDHTLLLKVRTWSTASLELLLNDMTRLDGVRRTQTMVVLSTREDRTALPVAANAPARTRQRRR